MASVPSAPPGVAPQSEAGAGLRENPEVVNTDAGIELEAALPMGASRLIATGPVQTLEVAEGSVEADEASAPEGPIGSSVLSLGPLLEGGARALGVCQEASDPGAIDQRFQKLLETVHANRPGDDLEIIRKAWVFCMRQHEGQKRASGEPYIIHPLEVGQVLAELKMDSCMMLSKIRTSHPTRLRSSLTIRWRTLSRV